MLTLAPRETRMPTTTTAKETWFDVMPADLPMPELLSHDELLDRLRDRGVDLASSALHYWRHVGILPRPIKRRHQGATRAVYPEWFVPVIEWIRHMQGQGASLDEIRERARPVMTMWALNTVQWADPLTPVTRTLDIALRQYADAVVTLAPLDGEIAAMRVQLLDRDGVPVFPDHDVPHAPAID